MVDGNTKTVVWTEEEHEAVVDLLRLLGVFDVVAENEDEVLREAFEKLRDA